MNRPIKFRAWVKNENAFIYSDLNDPLCHMNGYSNYGAIFHFIRSINNLSDNKVVSFKNTYTENLEGWEQFTGLLDSEGKEIYEGDIVKYNTNGDLKIPKGHVEEVYYSVCEARFYPIVEECSVLDGGSCEVIGNIHENPELLTK